MLKDNIKRSSARGCTLPKLHGHTVLTLTDAKTGREVKRIEKDNLVTDAVAKIFAQNYLGAIKYADITPVRNMFGGVMLFYDALTESASSVLLPDPSSNPVIAYAGQTAHATANTKRGNPNNATGGSGPTADGKGYKFVWDWATNQGNGTISAAALTFKDFGDIGPDPNPLVTGKFPFIWNTNEVAYLASGDRASRGAWASYCHGLICVTDNGQTGYTFDYVTKKLSKVAVNYKAQGVNNTLNSGEILEQKTVPGSFSAYGGVTWDASTGLFYFVEFSTATSCEITEYNFETEAYTTKTFTGQDVTYNRITPTNANTHQAAYINKFAKCGNYFFVYGSSGMYRLDWSQPSDIEAVDFSGWDTTNAGSFTPDVNRFGQVATGPSCVVGCGFAIYGLKAYAVEKPTDNMIDALGSNNMFQKGAYAVRHALTDDPNVQVLWPWFYGYQDNTELNVYAGLQWSPYLATVQNLEDVVTKDSTMTMKVVYTITVEDEEE